MPTETKFIRRYRLDPDPVVVSSMNEEIDWPWVVSRLCKAGWRYFPREGNWGHRLVSPAGTDMIECVGPAATLLDK